MGTRNENQDSLHRPAPGASATLCSPESPWVPAGAAPPVARWMRTKTVTGLQFRPDPGEQSRRRPTIAGQRCYTALNGTYLPVSRALALPRIGGALTMDAVILLSLLAGLTAGALGAWAVARAQFRRDLTEAITTQQATVSAAQALFHQTTRRLSEVQNELTRSRDDLERSRIEGSVLKEELARVNTEVRTSNRTCPSSSRCSIRRRRSCATASSRSPARRSRAATKSS